MTKYQGILIYNVFPNVSHHRAPAPTERPHSPYTSNFYPSSNPHFSTTMAAIDAALAALELLELGEDFKYSEYARKYGCSQTTLSRRHRKIQEARTTTLANGRLFNNTQEQQLVQYIKDLCARGLPPSRPMIRKFAGDIAKKNYWQKLGGPIHQAPQR